MLLASKLLLGLRAGFEQAKGRLCGGDIAGLGPGRRAGTLACG